MQDYGRASFDIRHRLFLGGTIGLPYALQLNPFLVVNSGGPFNVTVGQDLNADSIFNDRPAFANTSTPANDTRATSLGDFNVAPAGESVIPINYGDGPAAVSLNLRLSRTFGFGPEVKSGAARGAGGGPGGYGGGGRGGPPGGGLGGRGLSGAGGNPFGQNTAVSRRYNLTLTASARNIFNHINYGAPVGNLNSPVFGESNSLASGPFASGNAIRRIDLQVTFSF